MKLNAFEILAMNSPIRRLIQQNIEFKIFDGFLNKHNIKLNNGVILDAGYGSGCGFIIKDATKIICDCFRFFYASR